MKICSTYVAILTFSLCPWIARADWGLALFEPPSDLFEPPEPIHSMMRNHQRTMEAMEQAFFRGFDVSSSSLSSPHFEMANDPEHFQVVLNLPDGMSQDNVHVDFDERTRVLTISGRTDVVNEATGSRSSSQFSRSFTLDPFVDATQLTASFEQGALTVTAPKDVAKVKPGVRSIPVLPAIPAAVREELPEPPVEVKLPGPLVKEKLPEPLVKEKPPEAAVEEKLPEPLVEEEVKAEREPPKVSTIEADMDLFHIKERIERDRQRRKEEEAAFRRNPNERLEARYRANKTSELRRR